ncbi:hypothetical protein HDE_12589 [Halotydeus destructor]|nr:hypothetical protein HDE_12589 [Halotydeus destructor]
MRQSHKMAPEPRNRPKVPLKIPPQQDEGDYFKRLQEPEPFKGDFDHEVDDVNFDFAKIGMPRLKKLRQPIVQMPTGSLYQFEFPVERRTAKKVVPLSPVPPPRRLTASSLNELPDNGFSLPSQQEHCDNPVISKYFESFTCNNVQRATNGGGHNEPACFGSIFRATRTRGTLARGSPGQLGAPMAVKEATRTTSGPPFKTLDWGVEVDSMVDRVSGLPLPSEALKAIQESMQIGYERFLTQRLPSSDLITVEKKQNRIISLANRNGIPLTANFVEDMFEKRHRGFEPPKTNPALNHPLDLTDDELDHDDEPFFF